MGDYRTTTGEVRPLTATEKKRRRRLWFLGVAALVAALVLIGCLVKVPRHVLALGDVTTEEYAEVRPAVVGTVAEILVDSGENIDKGDLLVRLDCAEEQATLEELQSRVNQVEAELIRRQAEIKESKRELTENIKIAKLRVQNTLSKLDRSRELIAKGLIAASVLDDEKLKHELAQAELASLLGKDKTIYDKELVVLKQELAARRDAVVRAEAQLRNKEIRAPIGGQALRYEFVIGELVRPENVLHEIFGGDKQVLKLQIDERHATRVAEGQRYEAELASYRGLNTIVFQGHVASLRNVIQAEGQKRFRVVYCDFNPGTTVVPPGTTAEAKIFYGKSALWFFLFSVE